MTWKELHDRAKSNDIAAEVIWQLLITFVERPENRGVTARDIFENHVERALKMRR